MFSHFLDVVAFLPKPFWHWIAFNILMCGHVPLRNYSSTHFSVQIILFIIVLSLYYYLRWWGCVFASCCQLACLLVELFEGSLRNCLVKFMKQKAAQSIRFFGRTGSGTITLWNWTLLGICICLLYWFLCNDSVLPITYWKYSLRINVSETKGDSCFLLGAYRKVPRGSRIVMWPMTSRTRMTS